MTLKKQLIRSFMGVGVMKLLALPVSLVTSIILARVLGPEGFGQYAFIMALIPIIALPVNGGLPQLLTREVATFVHANQWHFYKGVLRASHIWVLATSAFILVVFAIADGVLGLVPSEGKWSLLPIAIWMVPLLGFSAARVGTIKGLGMPAYAELPVQVIQPLFMLMFLLCAVWLGVLESRTAIWGQVIGTGLVFLIASWMFYRLQPSNAIGIVPAFRSRAWRSALLPFGMLALVSAFNAQIGIIILGLLSTDEQVAAMRVAERAGQLVALSLTLVNLVIAPYIVRAHRDGDKALLQALAKKSARGAMLFAFPVAFILIVAGEPLIRMAFGDNYAKIAYWPVVIIAVGQLINVFFGSVGYLLSMSGFEKDTLKGQVLAVVISLILCVVLAPAYGAVGASIAVAVGVFSWNLLLAALVKKRMGILSSIL